MLEKLLGMSMGATLSDLGALAALTSIIVQVLKHIVPSKFPTQALVIIVALFVSVLACIMFYGLMIKAVGIGVLSGFVTAFIAMEGFDSLKSIWSRFTTPKTDLPEEEEGSEEVTPIEYNIAEDFEDEPEFDDWDDIGGEG